MVLAFLWPVFAEANQRQKIYMSVGVGAAGAASGWWYFMWVAYLDEAFGFHHFYMGSSIGKTAAFLAQHGIETLHMFYQKALGYSGFLAFAAGLLLIPKWKLHEKILAIISVTLMLGFMLKSGSKFTNHEYYIMPFIPFMAYTAGRVSEVVNRKTLIVALIVIAGEGVVRKWEDQFIKSGAFIATLDLTLDQYLGRDELIFINSNNYPTPMYFAHRKGWIGSNQQISDPAYRDELRSKGCAYVLILRERFGEGIDLDLPEVGTSKQFMLYKL
jgi:hypothetical protein